MLVSNCHINCLNIISESDSSFRSLYDSFPCNNSSVWKLFENRSSCNIGEIHYHKENKTNGGKQIEFSAGSNQFEQTIKSGNK